MIPVASLPKPIRYAYRTNRSVSAERNYLCTFLNELGERVDVFESLQGETFFMTHRREGPAAADYTLRAA